MKEFPVIDKKKSGLQIRDHMSRKGLCAKDIQNELRLGSVQCVYHWLNGRSLPTVDNLYALSVLLDVHVDELLVSQPPVPSSSNSAA